MDVRNHKITSRIFEVLNAVKGFDVAMSNPSEGKLITRYKNTSFYITIEPIFNDNEAGREAEKQSFDEIARRHSWIFR